MRGREVDEWLRHSGPGLVCLAQCISGVWYVPVMAQDAHDGANPNRCAPLAGSPSTHQRAVDDCGYVLQRLG